MYYKKYVGKNIYLSPMCNEDYKIFTKWVNDETLASGVGNFAKTITEDGERTWLDAMCKSGSHTYSIIRINDNALLGNYSLEIRNNVANRYHVGGLIGEINERNKGYGTEALKLITKYAFDVLNAQSVFSGIYSFNQASLKSAIKAGYKIAGKYRNAYYYNGTYHDEFLIEITREDFYKEN
ncbi:MAG: GNAT family protein [Mycoplasmatota bacterium]